MIFEYFTKNSPRGEYTQIKYEASEIDHGWKIFLKKSNYKIGIGKLHKDFENLSTINKYRRSIQTLS